MWYPAVTLPSPAIVEPVTLAQARRQCGVTSGDTSFDDELTRQIAAQRAHIEKYCSIKVPKQSISVKCDSFRDFSRFPTAPIISVASIGYVDLDGADQIVDPAVYEMRADGLTVSIVLRHGQRWPDALSGSRITVVAIAGYDPPEPDLVAAILLRIRSGFTISRPDAGLKKKVIDGVGSREWDTTGNIDASTESAVAALLAPYRCWPISC